jgi:hypothetical protein
LKSKEEKNISLVTIPLNNDGVFSRNFPDIIFVGYKCVPLSKGKKLCVFVNEKS